MDKLLAPCTIKYKAEAVCCFRFKNSKWQVKLISWEVKRGEVQSNSPSTQHQLCIHCSKDIPCRANSSGATCPNNCIFPLDCSGATHRKMALEPWQKNKGYFCSKQKGAQIMNSWTEIRLPAEGTKPHSLPALSLTTAAISKPHRMRKGER